MGENKGNSNNTWLQRLKDESWEAELLVSAIAIFGTFKLFDIISWVTNFFIDTLHPSQYFVAYFIVTFGLLAVSILAAMFVIHFVLRAYWIGLVGLNSVFPDYSIEDSAYSKIYTEKILSILPKLKDSIKKVDELCSVIFSVAFTFLLIYAYSAIFSSLYLLLFNLLVPYVDAFILLIPAGIIIIGAITQTILTFFSNLKMNKEKEGLQILNFKLVKFVSMIMFGPLYKNILQVSMIFGSNFKKKKSIVYLILVFAVAGIFMFAVQLKDTNTLHLISKNKRYDSTRTYADFYKSDNEKNDFLLTPEIESRKVTSNTLELFIPVYEYELKIRKENCGDYQEDDKKSDIEQKEARIQHLLDCYKSYNIVSLDGKKLDVEFLRYNNHPRTNQFGLVCYLDLNEISKGIHKIKVEKKSYDKNYLEWTIPFYYNFNEKR
ncbi:hypothetical protein F7018_17130 [Tenacibaculum aiptasiae]|uniref:Uncharacterized protein n=1 Tax=Tenacibaculum aiptasiae TaxID=426481 RepID=A0A7J5A791_9FLAO|nr:hypothetical protein [Tenacibaculum aiptasiae]KAB1153388.1 hypothetical protein F7018_17130 [Tenacibaculum aiptasiae]